MLRRTFIEINLDSLEHNLKLIKELIGADVKILLPVKADAYGHGLKEISLHVQNKGLVDMLGVATPEEGIELRRAGIDIPILVLGLTLPEEDTVDYLLDYSLSQTVADLDLPRLISKRTPAKKNKGHVHLKIDTGMGRIGCNIHDARKIARDIAGLKSVKLEGIFTHFPVADNGDHNFTMKQIQTFNEIVQDIEREGIHIPLKHTANSAAVINYPESHFNMVRPGIMSYGLMPDVEMKNTLGLKPVMILKSNIIFIKRVPAKTPLSYGLTYSTSKECNIATVPIGYGDGYSRFLSNKAQVLIKNKPYPLVGRVSMDQILINLGDDEFKAGTEVILFGNGSITASDLARCIGTIPYEITCGISKRVERIYIK